MLYLEYEVAAVSRPVIEGRQWVGNTHLRRRIVRVPDPSLLFSEPTDFEQTTLRKVVDVEWRDCLGVNGESLSM